MNKFNSSEKDAKSCKGLQSEQHVASDVCEQTLLTGMGKSSLFEKVML